MVGTAQRPERSKRLVPCDAAALRGKIIQAHWPRCRLGHHLAADFAAEETILEPDTMMFATSLYQASPAERVSLIRNGVPASRLSGLAAAMHVSQAGLLTMLNLPGASIRRMIREGTLLSTEQAERVIGLERLIGQVAIMVEGSGHSKGFDVARWVGHWLEQPIPALGGSRPADFMDTMTGQTLVSSLLLQVQAGVFA